MKLFKDLPSQDTPITAESLNQIKDKLVVVSATEPTGDNREKVWIQKGKNLFNGQISAGDQIGINSTIRLYTRQEIFVKKGSTVTFSTNLDTNTYHYLFQFLEKVPNYYLSQKDYTQIFDSGWKSATTFTYTATQDGFIALGFRKTDNSELTPSDISGYQYQIEYGPTATKYEEYIEPKIHVLNDNGVYEEFISKEDTLERYSTGEQKIGTWIDGKPLYRKIIQTTTPTVQTDGTTTWQQVVIPNVNFGLVVSGCVEINSNEYHSILSFRSADGSKFVRSDFKVNTSNNNGILEIVSNSTSYNAKKVIAIVEYTKTTD